MTDLCICLRVRMIRLRMLPAIPNRQTAGSATLLRNMKNTGSVFEKTWRRLAAALRSAARTSDVMFSTYTSHVTSLADQLIIVACDHVWVVEERTTATDCSACQPITPAKEMFVAACCSSWTDSIKQRWCCDARSFTGGSQLWTHVGHSIPENCFHAILLITMLITACEILHYEYTLY